MTQKDISEAIELIRVDSLKDEISGKGKEAVVKLIGQFLLDINCIANTLQSRLK